jgi:hypothetical protein
VLAMPWRLCRCPGKLIWAIDERDPYHAMAQFESETMARRNSLLSGVMTEPGRKVKPRSNARASGIGRYSKTIMSKIVTRFAQEFCFPRRST